MDLQDKQVSEPTDTTKENLSNSDEGQNGKDVENADQETELDLSFLDKSQDEKEDQKEKSKQGQIESAYTNLFKIEDEEARENHLKELPKYIRDGIIAKDKIERPHLYDNKPIVDKAEIESMVQDLMSKEKSLIETKTEFDKLKSQLPKTMSIQKQKKLEDLYRINLEDGIKPLRAFKLAISDTGIELGKEYKGDKLPNPGKEVKVEEKSKKNLFPRPKFLEKRKSTQKFTN